MMLTIAWFMAWISMKTKQMTRPIQMQMHCTHSHTHCSLSLSLYLSLLFEPIKIPKCFRDTQPKGGPVIIYTRASHRYFLFLPATAAASASSLSLFAASSSSLFRFISYLKFDCVVAVVLFLVAYQLARHLHKTITKTKNDFCRLVPHTHTCSTRTPLCTSTWYGGSNEVNAATGNSRAAPCNCGS